MRSCIFAEVALLLLTPLSTLGQVPCQDDWGPPIYVHEYSPDEQQWTATDITSTYTLKDHITQRRNKELPLEIEVLCDSDAAALGFDDLSITSSLKLFGLAHFPGSAGSINPTLDFTNVKDSWLFTNPMMGKPVDITFASMQFTNLQQTIDLRNVALTVQDCSFSNSSVTPLRLTFDREEFLASSTLSSDSPPAARIRKSSFSGNGWSSGDAGGIAFLGKWPGSSIEIVDTSFMTGKGDLSGAVSLKMMHGVARVRDCVFKENLSKVSGGALYIQAGEPGELHMNPDDDVKVSVESSSFIENGAYMRGGALYIVGSGKFNIAGNDFVRNSAGESGGAIFVDGPSSVWLFSEQGGDVKPNNFDSNFAGHKGGGMFYAKTVVNGPEVIKSLFKGNRATGWHITFEHFAQSTTEERIVIRESVKIPMGDGRGGALYLEADDTEFLSVGRALVGVTAETGFFDNYAAGRGGAICSEGRELTVGGVRTDDEDRAAKFAFNRAEKLGGAISVEGGRGFRLLGLVFESNEASTADGGAVAIREAGSCSIGQTVFRYNYAGGGGGGLSAINTVLVVSHSVFDVNVARHAGGAVRLLSSRRASFIQSSFTGNTGYPAGAVSVEYRGKQFVYGGDLTWQEALSHIVFQECLLAGNQVHMLEKPDSEWHGAAIHAYDIEGRLDSTNWHIRSRQVPLLQVVMNDVLTINNLDLSSGSQGNADLRVDGPATTLGINWYAGGTFTSQGHVEGSQATALVVKCDPGFKTMSAAEVNCKDCFWYSRHCNPTGSSQFCDTDNSSCRPPATRLAVPGGFLPNPPSECASLKGPKSFDWWKYMDEYSFYCVLLAKTGDVTESSSNAVWLIPPNQALPQWASSLDQIRELSQTQARAIVAAHSITTLTPAVAHNLGGAWVATTADSVPIYTVPPAFHATRVSKLGKPLFGPLKSSENPQGLTTTLRTEVEGYELRAKITRDFLETSEEPFDNNRIILIDAALIPPTPQPTV